VQGPGQSLGVFAYAWRFVAVQVPHAKSAAKIIYVESFQPCQYGNSGLELFWTEDLGPNMHVKTLQINDRD